MLVPCVINPQDRFLDKRKNLKQNWLLTFWKKIKTHESLETNIFSNQTTHDSVKCLEEFPLHQANKRTNTTFKMAMSKKKRKSSWTTYSLCGEKQPWDDCLFLWVACVVAGHVGGGDCLFLWVVCVVAGHVGGGDCLFLWVACVVAGHVGGGDWLFLWELLLACFFAVFLTVLFLDMGIMLDTFGWAGFDFLFLVAGRLLDTTNSADSCFIMAGVLLLVSGLLGFPLWVLKRRECNKTLPPLLPEEMPITETLMKNEPVESTIWSKPADRLEQLFGWLAHEKCPIQKQENLHQVR